MDYIMVNYKDNNMNSGTGKYISGTDIASEASEYSVTNPE